MMPADRDADSEPLVLSDSFATPPAAEAQASVLAPAGAAWSAPLTRRDVLRTLFKHKLLIAFCFLLVSCGVGAGLALIPLSYRSTAKVLVKTEQQQNPAFFTGVAAFEQRRDADPAPRRMETEMELIQAQPIAEEAVERLGLEWKDVYHPPLAHLVQRSGLQGLADRLGRSLFGVEPDPERHGKEPTAAALAASLEIAPLRSKGAEASSNIIEIGLSAPTAAEAQRTLATVLDIYQSFDARLNEQAGLAAQAIVEGEVAAARAQVDALQARMRTLLSTQGVADLADLPGSGRDFLLTTPREQDTLVQLKTRLVDLELELARTRQTFLDDSEQVRALQGTVDDVRTRVEQEIARDARTYAEYRGLDRDLDGAEQRLVDVERRLSEINLYLQITKQHADQRVIIEPPSLPHSSDIKKRMGLGIVGSLLGLLLGLGLAGLREYGDRTLDDKDDLRDQLGLQVAGTLPHLGSRALERVLAPGAAGTALNGQRRAAMPAFREIAAALEAHRRGAMRLERGGAVVVVTSSHPGEGKTTVALGTARELARQPGRRVLLIDSQFGEPSLSRRLGAEQAHGLSDALTSGEFDDAMILPGHDGGPDVLPAGIERRPNLVQDRRGNAAVLDALARRYDWVVVDGSSLAGGDVRPGGLLAAADLVLMVVQANRLRHEVVRDILAGGGPAPGTPVLAVLNHQAWPIPAFLYDRL